MFKSNIGILNAMIRITVGLTFVSYFSVRMIRHPWKGGSFCMMMMAAMRVAEGITRFCPVVEVFNRTQNRMDQDQQQNQNQEAAD